jgi:hypothetical protein
MVKEFVTRGVRRTSLHGGCPRAWSPLGVVGAFLKTVGRSALALGDSKALKSTRRFMGALVVGALGLHLIVADAGAAEAKKQITIAFIPGIVPDPFFKAMELGARNKA